MVSTVVSVTVVGGAIVVVVVAAFVGVVVVVIVFIVVSRVEVVIATVVGVSCLSVVPSSTPLSIETESLPEFLSTSMFGAFVVLLSTVYACVELVVSWIIASRIVSIFAASLGISSLRFSLKSDVVPLGLQVVRQLCWLVKRLPVLQPLQMAGEQFPLTLSYMYTSIDMSVHLLRFNVARQVSAMRNVIC